MTEITLSHIMKMDAKQSDTNNNQYQNDEPNFQTGIQDLPYDLLVEIFEYLIFSHRLDCTRVCKNWYGVLQTTHFAKHLVFKFKQSDIKEDNGPYAVVMKSERIFYSVEMDMENGEVNADHVRRFLQKIGSSCEILRLLHSWKSFDGLKYFPHLKELRLSHLSELKCFSIFPENLKRLALEFVCKWEDKESLKTLKSIKSLEIVTSKGLHNGNSEGRVKFLKFSKELLNVKSKTKDFMRITLRDANLLKIEKLNLNHIQLKYTMKPDTLSTVSDLQLNDLVTEISVSCWAPCWFGHKMMPFKNVTKCSLGSYYPIEFKCSKCLSRFLKSCPNIKYIKVSSHDISHFDKIFTSHHQFTGMVLENSAKNSAQLVFDMNMKPNKFEQLQHLFISNFFIASADIWDKMPQMPSLQYLKLHVDGDCAKRMERVMLKAPQICKFSYKRGCCVEESAFAEKTVNSWRHLRVLFVNGKVILGNSEGNSFILLSFDDL